MKLQVGVKALIKNERGEYLLIKRAEKMPGENEPHWDIPGGRIEPDEALHEALAREIFEETGLSIDTTDPRLLKAQDIFVTKADLHIVRLTFELQGEGDATISHEHQNAEWATPGRALEMNLDPYLREVLANKEN